jgi:predicted ester cyclase
MPLARIELSKDVLPLVEQSPIAQHFVRFAEALIDPDQSKIDAAVTPDSRFHELEAAGLPPGPSGLKLFRKQMNTAFPDELVRIVAMRFEGTDIIETDLEVTATHSAELMGIPATGKRVAFTVHTRNRFVDGRMAERWDKADIEDLIRQLKTP